MSVIWHKVWYDLWSHKGRTLLAILSIAAGLFAVGGIFGLVDQLLSTMDAAHRSVAPSHVSIILRDFVTEDVVDELKVTSHPNYQRHEGKPVLAIWGMGLHEDRHVPHDPAVARQLVEWFRSQAPAPYRVTYMGGTPARWRTLTMDARPEPGWSEVYQSMDVIQPWVVGRYRDNAGVDAWKEEMIVPDLALAARNKQLYMPVVFPGFSWYNLKRDTEKNRTPRNRGDFLWRQAYNARMAGATALKIAMFDEVNESTAIFKVAARRQDAPDQGYWLTLDADGASLPSDWYLRLAGEITRMFHDEIPPSPTLPADPGRSARAPRPTHAATTPGRPPRRRGPAGPRPPARRRGTRPCAAASGSDSTARPCCRTPACALW